MSLALPGRPPPEHVGRYRIVEELGRGGSATVYLARARAFGGFERLFALKMMNDSLSGQDPFIDLLLREASICARIHHPNVVGVHDVIIEGEDYFLSMDYVRGETFTQLLIATWNEGEALPLELAVSVVSAAAEGLHAAHELKDADGHPLEVVHRDVAPKNLMVGYDGVVRVMDFGIAKALDTVSLTAPGTWRGTVPYMAPEQVKGDTLDRRTDIFALGIILWETAVGERLFKTDDEVETLKRVIQLDVPTPSSIRPECPPELDEIILRALERDPAARYQTARELADDIADFLLGFGRRASPGDLARVMASRFSNRLEEKLALERRALPETSDIMVSPAMLEEAPPTNRLPAAQIATGLLQAVPSEPVVQEDETIVGPEQPTTQMLPLTTRPPSNDDRRAARAGTLRR